MKVMPSIEEARRDLDQTRTDIDLLSSAELAVRKVVQCSEIENKSVYQSFLRQISRDIASGQELADHIKRQYGL